MNVFTPYVVPIMSETDSIKTGTQEKEEYERRRSPREKSRVTSSSVPAKTVTSEVLFYYVIIQIIYACHKYYSSCLFSSIKYISFWECECVCKRYKTLPMCFGFLYNNYLIYIHKNSITAGISFYCRNLYQH